MLDQYQLLIGYLLLFVAVGVGFIFVHLIIGKLIRPAKPEAEKLTIYECGEPTIGSAWIQFDLRFYVVALLFVIFDVEVAFFFPWAVVFGRANSLAESSLPDAERGRIVAELVPPYPENEASLKKFAKDLARKPELEKDAGPALEALEKNLNTRVRSVKDLRDVNTKALAAAVATLDQADKERMTDLIAIDHEIVRTTSAGDALAFLAFIDIAIFFGVLLVGFAYLWKRGDLNWVRSVAAERVAGVESSTEREMVGAR